MLSLLAKELEVFIIGGSIPEEDGGKYFNTCTVFSPSGEMVAKHRKVTMYLFFIYLRLAICASGKYKHRGTPPYDHPINTTTLLIRPPR